MVLFRVHNSMNIIRISNITDWNAAETMTEPPMCLIDDCRLSLLMCCIHNDDDLNKKNSNLDWWLHQTCCHSFSVQFLCNLTYLKLSSLFPIINNGLLTAMLPLRRFCPEFLRTYCTPHQDIPSFKLIALWKSAVKLLSLAFLRFNKRNVSKLCGLVTKSLEIQFKMGSLLSFQC